MKKTFLFGFMLILMAVMVCGGFVLMNDTVKRECYRPVYSLVVVPDVCAWNETAKNTVCTGGYNYSDKVVSYEKYLENDKAVCLTHLQGVEAVI